MASNRNNWYWKLGIASFVAIGGALAISTNGAFAQIIPDSTLPNNSIVTPSSNTSTIKGGTRAGNNLFHSFEQFSVPTGRTVFFNNATDIQNIISRVTGKSISNIDGLIKANASANLFLINPKGIIFGPNASLNIGGSFLASTANAIGFGERGFFSASTPESPSSLLTVNPSALLFNQIAAAPIQNSSQARGAELDPSKNFNPEGLRVPDGKTLLLVGGNIRMDGGGLFAFGGRVELGGLADLGTVGIDTNGNNLSLSFPDRVLRANVFLTNGANVSVRAGSGGSIVINANNLEILRGSQLLAGIARGLGGYDVKAGDIVINTTEVFTIADPDSVISNRVGVDAKGKGGDVYISTGSLFVGGGAQLYVGTYGQGDAGSVTIHVRDTASFDGENQEKRDLVSGASSRVESSGVGQGGNVNLQTRSLRLSNGAVLEASTLGKGNAGVVNIHAHDIVINGESTQLEGSGIYSQVETAFFPEYHQGVGQGGNINIKADSLSVTNGAVITTSTLGRGNAGNVFINAHDIVFDGMGRFNGEFRRSSGATSAVRDIGVGQSGSINVTAESLRISNGASLITSTFGPGNAGNVFINARNIALDGVGSYLDEVQSYSFPSSVSSQVETGAVGQGAYVDVTADSLSVTNGAELATSSQGNNNAAGSIKVAARSIRLDNQGAIVAESGSGKGGNITLEDPEGIDLLLMRRGSTISAAAGIEKQGGDGGNITINAPNGFIVAVPNENSDITANAFTGSGGKVQINASSIFGTVQRSREDLVGLLGTNDPTKLDPRLLPTSDITAVSQTSPTLSGQVTINTPDLEINRGLLNLPTVPIDTEVAQGCTADSAQAQSEFIITGRGGLPPSPNDALSSDAVSVGWVTLNPEHLNQFSPADVSTNKTDPMSAPIVEAQGWVIGENGDIVLTATPPTATAHIPWLTAANCQTFKTRS